MKFSIIVFLFLASISNAFGQNSYLCIAEKSVGFDASKMYKETFFKSELKFLIKETKAGEWQVTQFGDEGLMFSQRECLAPIGRRPNLICQHAIHLFIFNPKSQKFSYVSTFALSSYGDGFSEDDPIMSIGKCSKL